MADIDMEPVYAEAEDAYDTFVEGSHYSSNGIRAAVDAARPLIEAAVREQVAATLDSCAVNANLQASRHAVGSPERTMLVAQWKAYDWAARIARGET